MDRELLIEIGCEEIPASWLPGLTAQLAQHLGARLKEFAPDPDAPVETFSTPRRLTARVAKAGRAPDRPRGTRHRPAGGGGLRPDGAPTPAAVGFAKKYGVESRRSNGRRRRRATYLAYRMQQRGRATVDVLPDVMAGMLRDMTFPKQMRWDAYLEDGKGDAGRSRGRFAGCCCSTAAAWCPFVIRRTELAQGPTVQDVRSGRRPTAIAS